jgi:ATP-dependent DNA helicase DinG
MKERHGDSFFSYFVPEAVIKFRQGAGRLIRTPEDRGVLVVLDKRIVKKSYGKQFIRSLDGEFGVFESDRALLDSVDYFFKNSDTLAEDNVRYVPLEDA